MLLLLAVTCGVAVGITYFPHAVTPLVAAGLHFPPETAALAGAVTAVAVLGTGRMLLSSEHSNRHRARPRGLP